MIIKDDVLNRQQELNVVGLIDKLTKDLDEHYIRKSYCQSRLEFTVPGLQVSLKRRMKEMVFRNLHLKHRERLCKI